jgi:hypothetical protein
MKSQKKENKLEEVIKQLIEEKGEETRALQKILKYISKEEKTTGMDSTKE